MMRATVKKKQPAVWYLLAEGEYQASVDSQIERREYRSTASALLLV
jgi:hypothetical protein